VLGELPALGHIVLETMYSVVVMQHFSGSLKA